MVVEEKPRGPKWMLGNKGGTSAIKKGAWGER